MLYVIAKVKTAPPSFLRTLLKIFSVSTLAVCCVATNSIGAQNLSEANLLAPEDLRAFLREFHSNPRETLNRLPQKKDENGRIQVEPQSPFPQEAINSGQYVQWRDELRQKIMDTATPAFSSIKDVRPGQQKPSHNSTELSINRPVGESDHAESLVDDPNSMIKRPQQLEAQQLTRGSVTQEPWSDSYWPIAKGMLGSRYAQAGFPGTMDWSQNHTFFLNTPASSSSLEDLSPAEKYDLIIGDTDFSLTNHMWKRGEQYITQYGKVPSWMGICHGWAAAASMLLPPQQQITVPSAVDGRPIPFFISDIKALLSGMWAGSMPVSRFMGGRCRVRSPSRDESGRISDPQCFDVNPGSWHMAIVNQLGKNHRSFVMDATYDFEVWNHPLSSYSYSYFNPQTLEPMDRIYRAIIPISQYSIDKFKDSRSIEAAYVVGINMAVTYVTEMVPNHELTHKSPPQKTVNYVYDLELDLNGNIIGGEWYLNRHPDFLWTFSADATPQATGDRLLTGTWDGTSPVPQQWRDAASRSAKKGQILNHIAQTLLTISRPTAQPAPTTGSDAADNVAPGLH